MIPQGKSLPTEPLITVAILGGLISPIIVTGVYSIPLILSSTEYAITQALAYTYVGVILAGVVTATSIGVFILWNAYL